MDYGAIPYSIHSLINNPSITLDVNPYYLVKDKGCSHIVRSCNGLICLGGNSFGICVDYWLCLWNPATKITSLIFCYFHDVHYNSLEDPCLADGYYKFTFGCDDFICTYKVVASRYNKRELRSNVKILSFGNYIWRDIESFPVNSILLDSYGGTDVYDGVYFRSTINWLVIQNEFYLLLAILRVLLLRNLLLFRLIWGLRHTINTYCLVGLGLKGNCLCFSYCYK